MLHGTVYLMISKYSTKNPLNLLKDTSWHKVFNDFMKTSSFKSEESFHNSASGININKNLWLRTMSIVSIGII